MNNTSSVLLPFSALLCRRTSHVLAHIPVSLGWRLRNKQDPLRWTLPCRNLGCMDPGCKLCEQNPRRRCTGNFAEKYLAGDPLKAKCGAAIRVEVIDQDSNEAVLPESVGDISLEV